MADDDFRIGQPPTAPRVLLVPSPAPARRGPGPWIVGTAAVLLVAIAIAGAAYLLGRADERTTAEPTPSIVALDEAATCGTLVRLLDRASGEIQEIAAHPDGSTLKVAEVDATLVGLSAIQPGAPVGMRGDIQAQIAVLTDLRAALTGPPTTLYLEEARASGIRLASLCRNYATN